MQLETAGYTVSIDVERTKNYYSKALEYNCPCSGCHNFLAAIDKIPEEFAQTLERMGVDIRKLMRVSALTKEENGEVLYDCIFRVVGTMRKQDITGPDSFIQFSDKDFYPCNDFPDPCVEASFIVSLPWVIEEKCTC